VGFSGATSLPAVALRSRSDYLADVSPLALLFLPNGVFLRMATRRSFDEISDGAWQELSDPLNFVIGAILLTFAALRHGGFGHADTRTRLALSVFRLGGALGVTAIVTLPVIVGTARPKLDTGDPTLYGLTLLVGGALALVPGRIEQLRALPEQEMRGSGYPRCLRKAMWIGELALLIVGVAMIVLWGFGGAGKSDELRALVWGAVSVSLADFLTLTAAVNFATAQTAVQSAVEALANTSGPVEPSTGA
jgi:hypothetical protein